MQLGELLEEIKIGDDEYKKKNTEEELREAFDEDLGKFKSSVLINNLVTKLSENMNEKNAPIIRAVRRASKKIESFENRLEEKGHINEAYAHMKYDSLSDDYKELNKLLENNKVRKSLPEEQLASAVAFILFESESMAAHGNFDIDERKFPQINENFKDKVNKEYKMITESVN